MVLGYPLRPPHLLLRKELPCEAITSSRLFPAVATIHTSSVLHSAFWPVLRLPAHCKFGHLCTGLNHRECSPTVEQPWLQDDTVVAVTLDSPHAALPAVCLSRQKAQS